MFRSIHFVSVSLFSSLNVILIMVFILSYFSILFAYHLLYLYYSLLTYLNLARNLVQFNVSKSQSCWLSHKKSQYTYPLVLNYLVLENKESFHVIRVALERNLNWYKHVAVLETSGVKKLELLFRARKYLFLPICTLSMSLKWDLTCPFCPRSVSYLKKKTETFGIIQFFILLWWFSCMETPNSKRFSK